MTALVGALNVNVNEISATLEGINCSVCLALIVGVYVARSAFNVNGFHFGAKTDSFYKVNGRNYRCVKPPFILKGGKLRLLSGAPEPSRVCGLESARLSCKVYGVILKDIIAVSHELEEFSTAVSFAGEILADALEAVFGAIYLDSQESEADYSPVILSLFDSEIENAFVSQKGDYKTQLQQLVEKDGSAILEYKVIEESGPEHNKTFTVAAKVNNNTVGIGTSKSKKDAEMQAAGNALKLFGVSL